jgi:hypothetical protein
MHKRTNPTVASICDELFVDSVRVAGDLFTLTSRKYARDISFGFLNICVLVQARVGAKWVARWNDYGQGVARSVTSY